MNKVLIIILAVSLTIFGFANVYDYAGNNDIENIRTAIKNGENLNEIGYNNKSALMVAIDYGNFEIAKALIEAGADINLTDNDGFCALHYASRKGNLEIVEMLVKKGAAINLFPDGTKFYAGYTPLTLACDNSRNEYTLETIKYLVENGANLEKVDFAFKSPLTAAVFCKSIGTIEFLLESGANPNGALTDGRTPLYLSISEGLPYDAVELLLKYGANTELGTEYHTPLSLAVSRSGTDVISLLIDYGANYNYRDSSANTLLHKAAGRNSQKTLEYLINLGLDVNAKNATGQTSLHIAAENGYFKNIQLLASKGANIFEKDQNGYLPMHIQLAVNDGNIDGIDWLLSCGVNINQNEAEFDMAPIHIAAANGDMETLEYIVGKGADVSIKAFNGQTPFHTAVLSGEAGIFDFLISHGADINVEDDTGKTPLFIAVDKYKLKVIPVLISKGADVNHTDREGKSAVHYAVQDKWDGIEMIDILFENGAQLDIVDEDGNTPYFYAATDEIKEHLNVLLRK